MKEFKCYDCEAVFEASSRDEILDFLYNHYMEEHKEIITGNSEEEKKVWMEQFDKDWSVAKNKTEK